MSKSIFNFLAGLVLAISAPTATAASSVATVPDGMISLPILHGVTNYLSLPLTSLSVYTTTVDTVTTNTLTVDDTPAPFTSSMLVPGSPYFIRFLSGSETGRVMLITAYTSNTLTVDTTDHISGEAVALTTTGFSVQATDTFEIFPGDTIASVFGDGSTANPLVLAGGADPTSADVVTLYTTTSLPPLNFYFNNSTGHWQLSGSTVNANSTIIFPYSAITVLRQSINPDTALVLTGRVTQVAPTTKLVSGGSVITSTHFATDITLSQLRFTSNWVQGNSVFAADTIGIWNSGLGRFDTFYQTPDSTWRKFPDTATDQSNVIIPAGAFATIAKKAHVAGAATFLESTLPYSLD